MIKSVRRFSTRAALFGVLCSAAVAASAQWSWIDKDGRKVFSDQPPPADIADKDITRRPGPGAAALSKSTASTAAGSHAAAAAKPAGTDRQLAEKIKQADLSETARKKAEQDRVAANKADNCSRARQTRATYDSGVTLVRINPQGEREVLDEAARNTETRRLDAIIASDCR